MLELKGINSLCQSISQIGKTNICGPECKTTLNSMHIFPLKRPLTLGLLITTRRRSRFGHLNSTLIRKLSSGNVIIRIIRLIVLLHLICDLLILIRIDLRVNRRRELRMAVGYRILGYRNGYRIGCGGGRDHRDGRIWHLLSFYAGCGLVLVKIFKAYRAITNCQVMGLVCQCLRIGIKVISVY